MNKKGGKMKKLILTFEANIPDELVEKLMKHGIKWEKQIIKLGEYKTKAKLIYVGISYTKKAGR